MGKMSINDEGPFAFLLRAHALGATHFFRAPESVEDIAGELLGENFVALVRRFRERTHPCLVEFKVPGRPRHVGPALWYLYLVETGLSDTDAAQCAGTCFDGQGTAILAAEVLAVERVTDPHDDAAL